MQEPVSNAHSFQSECVKRKIIERERLKLALPVWLKIGKRASQNFFLFWHLRKLEFLYVVSFDDTLKVILSRAPGELRPFCILKKATVLVGHFSVCALLIHKNPDYNSILLFLKMTGLALYRFLLTDVLYTTLHI